MGLFDWVEVAPFVWQDRYSSQTIAADVVDGRVIRISSDVFSPYMVLTPAPVAQNSANLLPLMGIAVIVILLQAILWPTRMIVRRKFGAVFALERRHLLVYRLTGLFSWGVVLSVVGWVAFAVMVSADVMLLGGALDWLINGLRFVFPFTAIALVLSSGIHLVTSFGKERSLLSHVGRILLLLSALLILWVIFAFNLYGFGLQF